MPNYTTEQFNRLPKWVKIEIHRLEENVQHYKNEFLTVIGENETTECNPVIRQYGNDVGDIPLPECTILYPNQGITITVRGGKVHISTVDGPIIIKPDCSNQIIVEQGSR